MITPSRLTFQEPLDCRLIGRNSLVPFQRSSINALELFCRALNEGPSRVHPDASVYIPGSLSPVSASVSETVPHLRHLIHPTSLEIITQHGATVRIIHHGFDRSFVFRVRV